MASLFTDSHAGVRTGTDMRRSSLGPGAIPLAAGAGESKGNKSLYEGKKIGLAESDPCSKEEKKEKLCKFLTDAAKSLGQDESKQQSLMAQFFPPLYAEVVAESKDGSCDRTWMARVTSHGATLQTCIGAGVSNPGHPIGLLLPDGECYDLFHPLCVKVVQSVHGHIRVQPPLDWGDVPSLTNIYPPLEPRGARKYAVSCRARLCRSFKKFPCNSLMNEAQLAQIQTKVGLACSALSDQDLRGDTFLWQDVTPAQLLHCQAFPAKIRMRENDKYLQDAGTFQAMPHGRSLFISSNKTCYVAVNFRHHLKVVTVSNTGDVVQAYSALVRTITHLEHKLSTHGCAFYRHDTLGYLTTNPKVLGTSLKLTMRVELPEPVTQTKLAELQDLLGSVVSIRPAATDGARQSVTCTENMVDITTRKMLGLKEITVLDVMYRAISKLVDSENKKQGVLEVVELDKAKKMLEKRKQVAEQVPVSMMEKHLLKNWADVKRYQNVKTSFGGTLSHCIVAGVKVPGGKIGVNAVDSSCYLTFPALFEPVISELLGVSNLNKFHHVPVPHWGRASDLERLGDLDPHRKYVLRSRARVVRNLDGYPWTPLMSRQQFQEVEQKITAALSSLSGKGKYYKMSEVPTSVRDKLKASALMCEESNKYLEASGAQRHYPCGRGVYVSDDLSLVVWVNASDHLKITCADKGGHLRYLYTTLKRVVCQLEKAGLHFAKDEDMGKYAYFAFCPSDLGTALKAAVELRLPELCKDMKNLEAKCAGLKLSITGCSTNLPGNDSCVEISNAVKMGTTEWEVLSTVYAGIAKIIEVESAKEVLFTNTH